MFVSLSFRLAVRAGVRSGAVGDFICDLWTVSACAESIESGRAAAYHVDASIPRNGDDGVQRAQVNTDNRHVDTVAAGYVGKERCKEKGTRDTGLVGIVEECSSRGRPCAKTLKWLFGLVGAGKEF